MLSLKHLVKLFLKWLLMLLMPPNEPFSSASNGKNKAHYTASSASENQADLFAEKALHQIKQAVNQFENNLNSKAKQFYETQMQGTPEDLSELNDLRADLAELKADIRSLKRMVNNSSETNGNVNH